MSFHMRGLSGVPSFHLHTITVMEYHYFIIIASGRTISVLNEIQTEFPGIQLLRSPSRDAQPGMEAYRIEDDTRFSFEAILQHYHFVPPFLVWAERIEIVERDPLFNTVDTVEMIVAIAADRMKSLNKPSTMLEALSGAIGTVKAILSGDAEIEYEIKIKEKQAAPAEE